MLKGNRPVVALHDRVDNGQPPQPCSAREPPLVCSSANWILSRIPRRVVSRPSSPSDVDLLLRISSTRYEPFTEALKTTNRLPGSTSSQALSALSSMFDTRAHSSELEIDTSAGTLSEHSTLRNPPCRHRRSALADARRAGQPKPPKASRHLIERAGRGRFLIP